MLFSGCCWWISSAFFCIHLCLHQSITSVKTRKGEWWQPLCVHIAPLKTRAKTSDWDQTALWWYPTALSRVFFHPSSPWDVSITSAQLFHWFVLFSGVHLCCFVQATSPAGLPESVSVPAFNRLLSSPTEQPLPCLLAHENNCSERMQWVLLC